jgi:hypothetical protein
MKDKSCHTNYMKPFLSPSATFGEKKSMKNKDVYTIKKIITLQTKSYLVTIEISSTKSKSQVTKLYPVIPVHVNSFELRQL